MNKRFDWMTPEEARNELVDGEFVWILNVYNEITAGQIYLASVDEKAVFVVGEEPYDHIKQHRYYKAFCRAIVPEVPNE